MNMARLSYVGSTILVAVMPLTLGRLDIRNTGVRHWDFTDPTHDSIRIRFIQSFYGTLWRYYKIVTEILFRPILREYLNVGINHVGIIHVELCTIPQ